MCVQVIAIRLFTGPMFMKYNAKLRNFPAAAVEALKNNGYVTTIHAVVSAIIKLSRTWKIPHDRKVYRGMQILKSPLYRAFYIVDLLVL